MLGSRPLGSTPLGALDTDVSAGTTVLLLNGGGLVDSTGRHALVTNDGTVTSVGGRLNFDGASALRIDDNLVDFSFPGSFTIEGQFMGRTAGAATAVFLSNYTNQAGDFQFFSRGTPTFAGGIYATGGAYMEGGAVWVDDAVHDWAFTYDATTNQARIYLDGTLTQSTGGLANYAPATPTSLYIGRESGSTTKFLNGQLRLRIVKGAALYTGDKYTAPTWPIVEPPEQGGWDPAYTHSTIVLSNANRRAAKTTDLQNNITLSNKPKTSGKWYFEFQIASQYSLAPYICVGVAQSSISLTDFVGGTAASWGYYQNDGKKFNNGVTTAFGSSWSTGSRIGIAVDVTAGKIWFARDGVWQASGDPAAGSNEAFSGLTGTLRAAVSMYNGTNPPGDSVDGMFSAETQLYTPPVGFAAWDERSPATAGASATQTLGNLTQAATGTVSTPGETWNPATASSGATLSNGNKTAESNGTGGGYANVRSTTAHSTGKWYYETQIITVANASSPYVGVANFLPSANDGQMGTISGGVSLSADGTLANQGTSTGGWAGTNLTTYSTVMIAVDMDAGKIWFGRDGVWFASGDPGAGTSPAATGLTGAQYAGASTGPSSARGKLTGRFTAAEFAYVMPTGFTAWDGTTDVNDVSWDPATKNAGATLTNSNKTAESNGGGGAYANVRSRIARASGKWYFETQLLTIGSAFMPGVGVSRILPANNDNELGAYTGGFEIRANGSKYIQGSLTSLGAAYGVNDVVMVAVDVTAGKVWFGKNGTWFASGNPAAGTGEHATGATGGMFAGASTGPSGSQGKLTVRLVAADQTYSAPSGFTAWGEASTGPTSISALAAQTLASITQTATAQVPSGLVASQTLAGVVQAATAKAVASLVGAQTLATVTQAAAATVTVKAAASQALDTVGQAATIGLVGIPTFTAGQTLAGVTQAATAAITITGTAAQTLQSITQAATGLVLAVRAASAVQLLDGVVQLASVQTLAKVSAAQTLAAVVAQAFGTVRVDLAATQSLSGVVQLAVGTVRDTVYRVSAAQTLEGVRQAARFGHLYVFVRDSRTWVIPAEDRAIEVTAEDRASWILPEDRGNSIRPEDRTFSLIGD